MQQPSSHGSASSGGTAFYDARQEVIRFVLGRRTLEALQGWTLSNELGNISMSRALTIDELMALSESGLVRSSSEDESMIDDGSSLLSNKKQSVGAYCLRKVFFVSHLKQPCYRSSCDNVIIRSRKI